MPELGLSATGAPPAARALLSPTDREEFREGQRRAWSAGDYPPVGRMLEPAARMLVERAGVGAGDRVLDVATGSGTVALAAALAGADVTGVDITDSSFDEGRRSAADAGVQITFQLGDAADLPAPDNAFDAVLSSFGAVLVPDHRTVAAELARVCRPGGTVALNAWPSDTAGMKLMAPLVEHLPDPPEFVEPQTRWGESAYVSELLEPLGFSVRFERASLPIAFPSIDAFETVYLQNGPMVMTRNELERQGVWDGAHRAWREQVTASNEAHDGTLRLTWDYVLILATST